MYMFQIYWPGFDGLQGPIISGTNFYIRRKALFGFDIDDGMFLQHVLQLGLVGHGMSCF